MSANIERFRAALLAVLRRELLNVRDGKLPAIMATKPDESIIHNLSRDQQLVADLFWGAAEIWDCQAVLNDIETFLRRNPYTSLGVSRSRYLSYHVGNFLSEIYVLHERVNRFTKIVERKYRKNQTPQLAGVALARKKVLSALAGLRHKRGMHVHERRFTTPGLHRLAGFEILAEIEEADRPPLTFAVIQHEYRQERAYWRKSVRETTTVAEKLLDELFAALWPVVFTDQDELKRPSHWPDA